MRLISLLLLATLAMQAQTLHVDDDASPGGNGSANQPFNTLPAAVAYAHTLSNSPIIQVAPGIYELSETLRIERSMTISGANQLEYDANGLPTGQLTDPATETRIVGLAPRSTIIVGKDGDVLRDVKFRNLTFQSGPTRPDLLDFARVQAFEVRDCILLGFDPLVPVGAGINTFASSGTIRHTYTTALLAAAFIGAGYPASPAHVIFRHNRSVRNRVGVFLVGTSDGITEPGDRLNAEVRDNDLSDNFQNRGAAGIRIIIKGTEGLPGGKTGLSTGNVRALIRHNRLVGNRVGIVIDGGFVTRRAPSPPPNVCDARTFSGSFDLTLRENELSGSIFAPSIITFTQFQAALTIMEGLPPNFTSLQFLHYTTFNLDDPDGMFADAYILHPETDPFVGPPCPADVTNELLQNTLRVNGTIVPNTAP